MAFGSCRRSRSSLSGSCGGRQTARLDEGRKRVDARFSGIEGGHPPDLADLRRPYIEMITLLEPADDGIRERRKHRVGLHLTREPHVWDASYFVCEPRSHRVRVTRILEP